MPVAIAGMHRSGTSMVARLLQQCGLDLGPTDQLLPPRPDNPEGFWEHAAFVALNDDILTAAGGSRCSARGISSGCRSVWRC